MALANLSCAWRVRYKLRGDMDDLIQARRTARDAVDASAAANAALGDRWAELGHVLRLRHDLTGDPDDAHGAVTALREAVAVTAGTAQDHTRLAALAAALLDAHGSGGDDSTLDEASPSSGRCAPRRTPTTSSPTRRVPWC